MSAPELRPGDVPMPPRIALLKRDRHGRVVPFFVAWVNGEPDHRIVDARRVNDALRFGLCFVCGQEIGRWLTFPVGPMCVVNRTTSEPPSHKDCAIYSARVCPFLTRPQMRRRDAGKPEGTTDAAGIMIKRNPGVVAIYTTRSMRLFPDDAGRPLIQMGDPEEVLWFAEGRKASREEAEASLESGCPTIRAMAEKDGPDAIAEFERWVERARAYLPPAEIGGAA